MTIVDGVVIAWMLAMPVVAMTAVMSRYCRQAIRIKVERGVLIALALVAFAYLQFFGTMRPASKFAELCGYDVEWACDVLRWWT